MVSVYTIVLAGSGRRYLPSYSMDGAALRQPVLKEMATEDWSSVSIGEGRKRVVVFK